jgi:hypothetical protein
LLLSLAYLLLLVAREVPWPTERLLEHIKTSTQLGFGQ